MNCLYLVSSGLLLALVLSCSSPLENIYSPGDNTDKNGNITKTPTTPAVSQDAVQPLCNPKIPNAKPISDSAILERDQVILKVEAIREHVFVVSQTPPNSNSNARVILVTALKEDLTLDREYGIDGYIRISHQPQSPLEPIVILDDLGNLFIAAVFENLKMWGIRKYTLQGKIADTWGIHGTLIPDYRTISMVQDKSGGIFIAGYVQNTNPNIVVFHLDGTGREVLRFDYDTIQSGVGLVNCAHFAFSQSDNFVQSGCWIFPQSNLITELSVLDGFSETVARIKSQNLSYVEGFSQLENGVMSVRGQTCHVDSGILGQSKMVCETGTEYFDGSGQFIKFHSDTLEDKNYRTTYTDGVTPIVFDPRNRSNVFEKKYFVDYTGSNQVNLANLFQDSDNLQSSLDGVSMEIIEKQSDQNGNREYRTYCAGFPKLKTSANFVSGLFHFEVAGRAASLNGYMYIGINSYTPDMGQVPVLVKLSVK